jgi:hypothetical protein
MLISLHTSELASVTTHSRYPFLSFYHFHPLNIMKLSIVLFLRALFFFALATSLAAGTPIPADASTKVPTVGTLIADEAYYLLEYGGRWIRTVSRVEFCYFFDLYSCTSQGVGDTDHISFTKFPHGLAVRFRLQGSFNTRLFDLSESELNVIWRKKDEWDFESELTVEQALENIQGSWEHVCRSLKV